MSNVTNAIAHLTMANDPRFSHVRMRHRLNFILAVCLIGFLVLFAFIIAALSRGEVLVPDILLAGVLIAVYVGVRVTKQLFLISLLALLSFAGFLVLHIFEGGGGYTSPVFCYVFPPIAIYLLGLRWGIGLSVLVVSPMMYFLITGILGGETQGYSQSFVVRFLLSYLVSMSLFQLVEYQRLKAEQEVKNLSGLLPICAGCKMIRQDDGSWSQIESYIQNRSDAQFSHGICPECTKELYPDVDLSGST